MLIRRYGKGLPAVLTLLCCLSLNISTVFAQSPSEKKNQPARDLTSTVFDKAQSYFQYEQANADKAAPEDAITVKGSEYSAAADPEKADAVVSGKAAAVLSGENEWCEWQLPVEKPGFYEIYLTYCPMDGTGKDILLSVRLDGALPFKEAQDLSLPRIWKDAQGENGRTVTKDSLGNDIRPRQVEVRHSITRGLSDIVGLYSKPYGFYLGAGQRKLRLSIRREALALYEIRICNSKALPSYQEYRDQYGDGDMAEGETVYQQAEQTFEKTSAVLYPVYDRTTPATRPNDPYHIRLNTIGQTNWSAPGMAISWRLNIKKDGLYRIAMRARQSYSQGLNSYRNLYINGEIPFAEARNIAFPYDQDWYIKTLGGDQPQWVYLKAGDILTLECTTGEMSGVLRDVQEAVLRLNALYRKIIIITGITPDVYRDYDLDSKIPSLLNDLKTAQGILRSASENVKRLIGKSGSQASTIDQVLRITGDFVNDTYEIPERLGSFKDSIESLGSLILTLGGQPLELDYIALMPKGGGMPKASASFGDGFMFGFKKFIASFFNDYNSLGGDTGSRKSIKVWVSTGRDQAQMLNNLLAASFTEKTGIPVTLSMVDTGATLIQATLAGQGPDAALMIPKDTPVNLAMRGALIDLSGYDISGLNKQFYESSWTPFRYNGGIYALPETQTFDMLFYRTDIFEELGLTVPDTWDEFYHAMEIIQGNNLQVGILEVDPLNMGVSAGISTFDKFLFQGGGRYYNDPLTKTEFDTEAAYAAFEKWVQLYNKYGLDRDFSFFNRFRSGEMPMGIASYSAYNQLSRAAPEIRGLWGMAPIPGTANPNGTTDRSESSAGTGCMILKAAEKRGVADEAFSLISWWASTETQVRYGRDLEATLGVAARYAPASVEAFQQMGWSDDELDLLNSQWKWVKNPPQIPGNYTVARSLTNAFRSAIGKTTNIRRFLSTYNKDINDEIKRKRKEFNLD